METQENSPSQFRSRNISTHDLLHAISKLKWLILVSAILIGTVSFWYCKTRILSYSSSASFYINDINSVSLTSPNNETKPLDGLLTGENFNRVYQLISSTRTQNYLIRKFGLLKHYHIDSTKEFSYEKAINRLRRNIEIKKSPFNMVTITVHDEYRYLAAEMANEIVSFVDKLNKDILLSALQRKIQIYQGLIKEMQKTNQARIVEMESLLKKMNGVFIDAENKKYNAETLLMLQQKMSGIISDIETANGELIRAQRYHSLALQIIKEKNLPTILMMQYATPYSYSLAPKALGMSIVFVIFCITMFIVFLYWKMRYGNYISLFFKS
ncbi:MAG: hypothetical protein IPG90_00465 [Bacteroidetes bacterium]|nr:hypothetical protein [Bacteroidota bacterium]MBK6836912.1 hypothetical protein [Bacteroidota bacterium]MBK9523686.1 hypothetical protein [Bacteroidota bacterium]MBK9541431.1 hypothetical protein [Bacteroidota bacterium]